MCMIESLLGHQQESENWYQELKLPDEPWEQAVMQLIRTQPFHYPGYLKSVSRQPMFTDREYQVYPLLIAGFRNAKIASILNITERTVKHYTAEIYAKLGVKSRSEAMNRAMELGDIF